MASVVLPVDEFIDWAFEYHAGQVRHQHRSNTSIEIDGVAHVETYYRFVGSYPARPPTVALPS
jgi:hypothetical protein